MHASPYMYTCSGGRIHVCAATTQCAQDWADRPKTSSHSSHMLHASYASRQNWIHTSTKLYAHICACWYMHMRSKSWLWCVYTLQVLRDRNEEAVLILIGLHTCISVSKNRPSFNTTSDGDDDEKKPARSTMLIRHAYKKNHRHVCVCYLPLQTGLSGGPVFPVTSSCGHTVHAAINADVDVDDVDSCTFPSTVGTNLRFKDP